VPVAHFPLLAVIKGGPRWPPPRIWGRRKRLNLRIYVVGMTGFEPATQLSSADLKASQCVRGTAGGLHLRMIAAMQESYAMNIVCGLHEGTWGLFDVENRMLWQFNRGTLTTVVNDDELTF
jgi:hypothetical protein